MSISLLINTCAGRNPRPDVHPHNCLTPYEMRAYALRNFVLPAAIADPDVDEVIVAGEWEEGEGYTYVPAPSIHFSSDDALHQRQAAFKAAKGDWLVFQHDDHVLENNYGPQGSDFGDLMIKYEWDWPHAKGDVIIPQRWTRLRNVAGERLPNGEPQELSHYPESRTVDYFPGYISGHCTIYRREVLEACPWSAVPVRRTWDIAHTRQIRAAGFTIHWSSTLRCWDVELGSQPWK